MAAAVALGRLPLLRDLGYEFAWAMGLWAALAAPAVGARLAATPGWGTPGRVALGTGGAWLPAPAWVALVGLVGGHCHLAEALGWCLAGPLASAAYGGVWGWAVAALGARWRPGARRAALVAVWLGPLGAALGRLWQGPAIFSFDPLWGFFAGSLYDEALALDARVWLHRVGTVAWALALVATVEAARRPGGRAVRGAQVALAGGAALACWWVLGGWAGYRAGADTLARALPVVVRRPPLVVHLPPATAAAQAAAVGDELAFRLAEGARWLGVAPAPRIDAYVFASADAKARALGARETMFARPWRQAIYVHGLTPPLGTAAHELVHVLAAACGAGPARLSSRAWVGVQMAWVEGLAEAGSPQLGELDLEGAAAALVAQGRAPPLAHILGPAGFWGQPPARAYALAGGFIAWLRHEGPPAALCRAYAHGEVAPAYGRGLAELEAAWHARLGQVPLSVGEAGWAEQRFRRPSLLERRCGREVARLWRRLAAARGGDRLRLARALCRADGDSPQSRLALGWATLAAADRTLAGSLTAAAASAGQEAQALLGRSDAGWEHLADAHRLAARAAEGRGDDAAAAAAYQSMRALPLDAPRHRQAVIGAWALGLADGRLRARVQAYLADGEGAVAMAALLGRAAAPAGADPTLGYLLGRLLAGGGDPAGAALAWLRAGPHPDPQVEGERLRLLAEAHAAAGAEAPSRAAWRALAEGGPSRALRALAADRLAQRAWQDRAGPA